MKKFDGILICTDLDGTLLRNDKTISAQNRKAIEYFKAEGGIFTFITGRMPYFVTDVYKAIQPNAPFGCINGGGIYDHRTKKYLWTQEIPHSVLDLVEYVDKNLPDIGIQVNTFDTVYSCKENPAMIEYRKLTKIPKIARHYREIKAPIGKIVFCDKSAENINRLMDLLRRHPQAADFNFIRSEYTLYEILPKGISKGNVLSRLAQLTHVDMEKTIAVGDYNNDVEMLRVAKIGIAVANACPEAKAAADVITVSNEEHAIAKILSDLEDGLLKL